MTDVSVRRTAVWLAMSFAFADGPVAAADRSGMLEGESVERRLEELARQNRDMRRIIERLEQEVRAARDEARRGQAAALEQPFPSLPAVSAAAEDAESMSGIASGRVGRVDLQLLDVSLDTLFASGWSTASDDQLEFLQGGEHDPRQRGFTLQQVELGMQGAVDPYLRGQAYLIYFIDTDGESRFELEEAVLTTMMLPFGLEEHGLQLQAGQYFTDFGRINGQHPHQWDWQDQPVILNRLFGPDGLRGPGIQAQWLTPLPWYSELIGGVQNAKGETMTSFLSSDETFEEGRGVGGRPFAAPAVGGPSELAYLVRWVNGFDLSDTTSTQLGASALFGPNAAGGDTWIAGGDVVVKWRPLHSDRGWPFVIFQSELAYRDYFADSFLGCPELGEDEDCTDPAAVSGATLKDWGFYTQLLWGFVRNWATGVRLEYAGGDGNNIAFDPDAKAFEPVSRNSDPLRANRWRVSPLLSFQPSEFSRLRFQYNFDHADDLSDEDQHSVWAGVEFLFGAHPAHTY